MVSNRDDAKVAFQNDMASLSQILSDESNHLGNDIYDQVSFESALVLTRT